MNDLQHGDAFVISVPRRHGLGEGRVAGRLEQIASGRCRQFESADAVLELRGSSATSD
jgi:hypothetical protein